jgi:hypothetical protein
MAVEAGFEILQRLLQTLFAQAERQSARVRSMMPAPGPSGGAVVGDRVGIIERYQMA